jgi:hypothetical protein
MTDTLNLNDDLKVKLADMLKHHDWWYQMSDDSRWYDSGKASEKAIIDLIKQIGNEGVDMYNAAKPQDDYYHKMEYLKG